jgi:signal transduction histidine kinase
VSILKKKPVLSQSHTHLYWAILLLVVAVVLPTVCLLWFVGEAVRNEQLAIRQRLIDIYSEKAKGLGDNCEKFLDNCKGEFLDLASLSPAQILEKYANTPDSLFQGTAVYNGDGQLIYPQLAIQEDISDSKKLEKGWRLEFVDKDYSGAADAYSQIADTQESVWGAALAGKVRCLKKEGRATEAEKYCEKLAWPEEKRSGQDRFIAEGRLMQIELYKDVSSPDLRKVCGKVLENRFLDLKIDSPTRVFLLKQCINSILTSEESQQMKGPVAATQRILSFEEVSITAGQLFPDVVSLRGWPEGTTKTIKSGSEKVYGVHFAAGERFILGVVDSEKMSAFWGKAVADMNDKTIFTRILDDTGWVICPSKAESIAPQAVTLERFLNKDLAASFAGWKVELFFKDNDFTVAAKRQKLVYFWILTLVIGSMLLVSALLTRSIWQQVKLNKLKNDFIATVTHELKTPLSSMRVLVDTLLDERVSDSKQSKEYLALISGENERLSRLIDSFLTFSRMERGKKTFDFRKAEPAEIAKAAVEAVGAKFNKDNCKLTVTIDELLPSISADKDAIVTVLVNLLDNAYKYSYDDKQVELKVFSANGQVCFSVKDNGIGMSRRVVKKIFNKFYQADSSLSRRAGGCGLGLSIVKFIVDAHKGSINVESEPGKKSVFTVRLPVTKI